MAAPRVSDVDWPILLVEWADASVREIEAHFVEMRACVASHEGFFAVVVDAGTTSWINAGLRARTAKSVDAATAEFEHRLCGVAYVAPSSVLRGLVTAIHWLVPPRVPITIVADRREAFRWARERLLRPPSFAHPEL